MSSSCPNSLYLTSSSSDDLQEDVLLPIPSADYISSSHESSSSLSDDGGLGIDSATPIESMSSLSAPPAAVTETDDETKESTEAKDSNDGEKEVGSNNSEKEEEEEKSNTNYSEEDQISVLKLEEKIVSLMNRVWLLETENNVLRSKCYQNGEESPIDETVDDLYRDPYAKVSPSKRNARNSSSSNLHVSSSTHSNLINHEALTPKTSNETNHSVEAAPTAASTTAAVPTKNPCERMRDRYRALRTDLAVAETVQEHMRQAMVTLETKNKLQSELIDELSMELHDHTKAMTSLEEQLDEERVKVTKLKQQQTEALVLTSPITSPRRKECIDRGGSVFNFNSPTAEAAMANDSSAAAAQLISDLSDELKLTLEREAKLQEDLEVCKRRLSSSILRRNSNLPSTPTTPSRRMMPTEADFESERARDAQTKAQDQQQQREKKALMEHNEELESLNIELIRKYDVLETKHNKLLLAHTAFPSHPPRINDQKLRASLSALSNKYETSQKEVALLKSRLVKSETALYEIQSRSLSSSTARAKKRLGPLTKRATIGGSKNKVKDEQREDGHDDDDASSTGGARIISYRIEI